MSTHRDSPNESLLEMAATAFRESDATGRVLPSTAWFDLSAEDRERLFDLQVESRVIERAMDPDGMSGTGRAVLAKIQGLGQLG